MKIILVRHGETMLNHNKIIQGKTTNPSLNENGINQIKNTAQKIKEHDLNINYILASPLVRAIETAEIIRRHLNFKREIIISNDFIERDFGPYEGMEIKFLPYYGPTKDGYENNDLLIKRMKQSFQNLKKSYKENDCILICSHSHAIKGLLVDLFPEKIKFDSRIKNGDYFIIETTAKTISLLFTSYNSF